MKRYSSAVFGKKKSIIVDDEEVGSEGTKEDTKTMSNDKSAKSNSASSESAEAEACKEKELLVDTNSKDFDLEGNYGTVDGDDDGKGAFKMPSPFVLKSVAIAGAVIAVSFSFCL